MTYKSAYRPKSVTSRARKNSDLLEQIRRKPVGNRRSGRNWPDRNNTGTQATGRVIYAAANSKKNRQGHRPRALSMPLLPVLGVIFLGTFFIIDNRDALSGMMHRDVVAPMADSGNDTNLAAFSNGTLTVAGELNVLLEAGGEDEADLAAENAEAPVTPPAILLYDEVYNKQDNTADNAVTELPETIPLKIVEYFAWESYTVKRGDSVSSIAAAHSLSMDAVIVSNNLVNAHILRIGQELRLPNMNGIPYTVSRGDNLSKIAQTYNIPLEVIVDVNNIQRDLIFPGQTIFLPGARMPARDLRLSLGTLFISPLGGAGAKLTSAFGWREDPFGSGQGAPHEAIDLAIAEGTPIKAAAGGKVAVVATSPVYGRYIIIEHEDNYQTMYAHLSVWSVRQGDQVVQGAKIGEVGNTGLSTGPHLHFGLFKNGRAINPLDYVTL